MDWGERFGRVRSLLQTEHVNHQHSRQLMLMLDRAFEVDADRCIGELCSYIQTSLASQSWPALTFLADENQTPWWAHVPSLIWLRCGQLDDFNSMQQRFPAALWSLGFPAHHTWAQILAVLKTSAASQIALLDLNDQDLSDAQILELTALENLGHLQILMLEDNLITNKGAIALSKTTQWSSLQTLYLEGNAIKKTGRKALEKRAGLTCHWG